MKTHTKQVLGLLVLFFLQQLCTGEEEVLKFPEKKKTNVRVFMPENGFLVRLN
jgi:hypothetical protein